MNLTNFVQTGGFPVKAERLQELQTAYSIFNQLGFLAGNLTIISGCTITGSSVSDGYVFINGELLPFKGGFLAANVIIIEEVSNKEFENGELKPVHFERYATFGTASTFWAWSSFVRPMETKSLAAAFTAKEDKTVVTALTARIVALEKKTAIFMAGGVVFPWFLPIASIPAGFQVVTSLAGKTIFGLDTTQAEFNSIGKTGGVKSISIAIANLPAHDHYGFANETADAGLVISSTNTPIKEGYNPGGDGNQNYRIRGSSTGATVGKTSKTGSNTALPILAPYKTAVYIEYIG